MSDGAVTAVGDDVRRERRRRAVVGLLNRTTLHPWTTDREALADEIVELMARLDAREAAESSAKAPGDEPRSS